MALKKNTAATITFGLVNASDGSAITSGSPSANITQDAGTQAAATNSPVHEGNGQWSLSLTAAEMNADNVGVHISGASAIPVNKDLHTQAKLVNDLNDFDPASDNVTVGTNNDKTGYGLADNAITAAKIASNAITSAKIADGAIAAAKVAQAVLDKVWDTTTRVLTANTNLNDPTAGAVADAVWDEDISGSEHNVQNSGAKYLRDAATTIAIRTATAQGGASQSITLDSNASSTDGIYNRERVTIINGTGQGQGRIITDYDGTTKVATVDRAWHVNPDSSSEFSVTPADADLATVRGVLAEATDGELHARDSDGNTFDATTFSTHSAGDVWDEATADHSSGATFGGLFEGMTRLRQWLGLIAGKQTGNSTARNELRATGAGSGTYDESTDSLEAQRDELDKVPRKGAGTFRHRQVDSDEGNSSADVVVEDAS